MSQLADEQVLLLDLLGEVENLLRVIVPERAPHRSHASPEAGLGREQCRPVHRFHMPAYKSAYTSGVCCTRYHISRALLTLMSQLADEQVLLLDLAGPTSRDGTRPRNLPEAR
jgi:hypothetical protein